jgi:hypothetical protein
MKLLSTQVLKYWAKSWSNLELGTYAISGILLALLSKLALILQHEAAGSP